MSARSNPRPWAWLLLVALGPGCAQLPPVPEAKELSPLAAALPPCPIIRTATCSSPEEC